MTTARGSQHQVTTLDESTYGTSAYSIPGDTQVVPVITNNVNLTKALFDDPTIYPDSQSRYSRHGNLGVAGDVGVVYTVLAYDDWMQSLFQNTWSTNVLKIGSTNKSITMERGYLDIDQYQLFEGMVANSFSLEVNTDGVVQSTFGFIGRSMTLGAVAQDSAPTAAPTAEPFVHLDGTFKEGGTDAGCTLVGISLSISKNLDQLYCLGNDVIKEPYTQMFEISGTATFYFEDATIMNKFINETASSLEITLDDGSANTHTFLLPNIKYNTGNVSLADAGIIPVEMEFVALYDDSEATSIKLTRSA